METPVMKGVQQRSAAADAMSATPRCPPAPPRSVLTDYRIEKVRSPVCVVLTGGDVIVGDIFLSPVSRIRQAPQDPIEFLNDEDGYFALASDDGRAMLVAKENVDRVEALLPDDGPRAPSTAHALDIELVLRDGTTVRGAVVLDTPSGRSRLLDYLNSHRERFLPMHQEDRLLLVNRRAIVRVHELP